MTKFKSKYGRPLLIEGLLTADGPGLTIEANEGGVVFKAEAAPAIAAAVLETAGVKPTPSLDGYNRPDGFSAEQADQLLGDALAYLMAAIAVREYHAKPRVSDEVVDKVAEMVAERLRDTAVSDVHVVRLSLEAALDSGVLVPADNKEGDRGE